MARAHLVGFLLLICLVFVHTTTVTPTLATTYYANGMSGMYKWLGWNVAPLANRDAYMRFSWRELEPTQGNYDFSGINALLSDAQSTGGKAGLRIMTCDTYSGGKSVPDYFATSANGWTCAALSNTWVPNWNGATLLTRLTALLDALAAQYANDARLAYLDVGLYGNYAEWHNAELIDAGCFPGPAPNYWGAATLTRKKEFINLITSRFPNKYVVLNYNDYEATCFALSGNRLGLRGDTFSDASWTSSLNTGDQLYELIRRQYRVQPFIAEFSTSPDFTKMKQNALEDHRATAGNGNFPLWVDQPAAQKTAMLEAAKWVGPRITVSSATWTTSVAPGGCLTLSLTFINSGSSRVYDKWSTLVQLRSGSTVSYQTPTSIADIRNVMPTNDAMASWTESNSFTIPETLAPGTYSVVLLVKDMSGYRPNFRLAITPANADDTYTLGSISVSASASIPATCVTRTAWAGFTQKKYLIGPGVNSWNDHPLGPIYTDFLFWGWQEELNGATGNVANTNPVWGGSNSIAFTTSWAWGIWGMVHVCGIDITGYSYVHFRMRAAAGASSGSGVFFYPYQSPWTSSITSVDLVNYGGNPVSTAWKTYNIPLSAFTGLPSKIDHLVFGGYISGATFYIDDISFSDNVIA